MTRGELAHTTAARASIGCDNQEQPKYSIVRAVPFLSKRDPSGMYFLLIPPSSAVRCLPLATTGSRSSPTTQRQKTEAAAEARPAPRTREAPGPVQVTAVGSVGFPQGQKGVAVTGHAVADAVALCQQAPRPHRFRRTPRHLHVPWFGQKRGRNREPRTAATASALVSYVLKWFWKSAGGAEY